MSDNKLVFFDIDGTLIHHRKDKSYIPDSAVEAVKKLKENGHTVAIASGRGFFQMMDLMEYLDVDKAVSFNGHELVDGDKILFRQPLHKEDVKKLIDRLLVKRRPFIFWTEDGMYLKDFFGFVRMRHYMEAKPIANISSEFAYVPELKKFDYERDIEKDIYSFMVISPLFKEFAEYENILFKAWGSKGFEVTNKDMSKLSGVKEMAKYLDFDLDDVYVFGDSYNDIEMIGGIKNSIAMGNGVDEIKEVAAFTTKDIDEDGIYHACEYFGLI